MIRILALLFLFLLSGCIVVPDGIPTWDPRPLHGFVYDCQSNVPIEGATITSDAHEQTAKTDKHGHFYIEGKRNTDYVISFSDMYLSHNLKVNAPNYNESITKVRYQVPSLSYKMLDGICLDKL